MLATNWPTRNEARHTMPRESRKGHNIASRRTYESRRTRAVATKLDDLQARAERYFARRAAIDAQK